MLTILLFAEDSGHRKVVECLSDGVFCERPIHGRPSWIDEDHLPYLRAWRGVQEGEPFTAWKRLNETAKQLGVRHVHGKFAGAPGDADASMYRKALRTARALSHEGAVVLARDLDRARTREAYEQALRLEEWRFAVVLAAPDPETEAWYVAGFEPRAAEERAVLEQLRQELGFHPHECPERLSSTSSSSATDSKRVLSQLTQGSLDRKDAYLSADLELLRSRGERCGLRAFLDDVERRMAPLLHATS